MMRCITGVVVPLVVMIRHLSLFVSVAIVLVVAGAGVPGMLEAHYLTRYRNPAELLKVA